MRTLTRAFVALAVAASVPLVAAGPAHAGGPTGLTLTGPGLAAPVIISTEDQRFNQFSQVVSLFDGGRKPTPSPPAIAGEQYVLVFDFHEIPTYRFELYPNATGGPHYYFPAEQPRPGWQTNMTTGWYRSGDDLRTAMRAATIRLADAAQSQPAAAPPPQRRSDSAGVLPWLGGATAVGLLAAAAVTAVRRRRPEPVAAVAAVRDEHAVR